jgi:SAM-dependent methyltransferase
MNAEGVRNANVLTEQAKVGARAAFQQFDVSKPLLEKDDMFDAVYSNDVLCHVRHRAQVLAELFRVLKRGGDSYLAMHFAIRSSIGMYFFSPPGENEHLIKQAGFKLLETRDTTESAATLSKRWHVARNKRKSALVAKETEANFSGLQRFLTCVHSLASERRLLRLLYVMEK